MSVLNNKKILNASKLSLILNRLASQLFENHNDFSEVVLIGLQPRGTILSKKLKQLIEKNYSIKNVNLGFLDVTFFRDDFGRGDKILSSGGMRGKVVRVINDNDIEVEISNGINVVMVKSTIAEVVKEQS